MHLNCDVFLSRPLFDEEQLDTLQRIVNELLPSWSRTMRVGVNFEEEARIIVGRDRRLVDCIHSQLLKRTRIADADLVSDEQGLTFYLTHSDSSFPLECNYLTSEIIDVADIEGRPADLWARDLFEELTGQLPVRYAKAYLNDEYYAKNMICTKSHTSAVGAQLLRHLPGLYWLNYFGPPYCDLMGRDQILTAPGYEVWPNGEGVIVALGESPEEWNTPAYQRRERAVIEHLGKPYFFSRDDPQCESLAPDFYAIEKKRKG